MTKLTSSLIAAAMALSACVAGDTEIRNADSTAGTILADIAGMSLYVFDKDTPAVSNCYGDCAFKWLPHAAGDSARPEGEYGIVLRTDCSRQWTYQGGRSTLGSRMRSRATSPVTARIVPAVARRHTWRREAPALHWLYRILVNRHRDTLRRRPVHLVALGDIPQPPARSGGQEAYLHLREVQDALMQMPVDQRQVLVLVAVEGLSFDQVATVLNIPKGTVMSRLGRARTRLRILTGRDTDSSRATGSRVP